MPRPGPRPYECVRRAWHSDRHQPIRGSIIQQIFRAVTEAHSSSTRKNREWQEKLPRVVLKAEEIMYSKANSEAEYMDPETLWDRLNDAVDTIIRRDESAETGQFLQPCIEAALVLGCVPVRASRSQRHTNLRSYLTPRFQQPAPVVAPPLPDKTTNHRPPPQPPSPSGNQLNVSRSTMANQTSSISLSTSQPPPNSSYIATHTGPHLHPDFPRPMPSIPTESNTLLNLGSVYPLYYGSHIPNIEPQFRIQSPQNPNPNKGNNIIVGTPVGWSAKAQPTHFASTRNLLPGESAETSADKLREVNPVGNHERVAEKDCDLSLRLGPSDSCVVLEKGLRDVSEDGGSRKRASEFCFFPRHNGNDDPSESCKNRVEQECEVRDRNETLRKRKAPDYGELGDGYIQWLQDPRSNQSDGQVRWRGL